MRSVQTRLCSSLWRLRLSSAALCPRVIDWHMSAAAASLVSGDMVTAHRKCGVCASTTCVGNTSTAGKPSRRGFVALSVVRALRPSGSSCVMSLFLLLSSLQFLRLSNLVERGAVRHCGHRLRPANGNDTAQMRPMLFERDLTDNSADEVMGAGAKDLVTSRQAIRPETFYASFSLVCRCRQARTDKLDAPYAFSGSFRLCVCLPPRDRHTCVLLKRGTREAGTVWRGRVQTDWQIFGKQPWLSTRDVLDGY
ncbi:hypothetical protein BD311DRAFT_208697 [Dichomitus squalens]|uniref:Uncharacterized protein n=1 Tax=Dichomitus squalens TaxID=114155 RepID=A0A4Q9N3W6_9APHY|nr:hypothetical protein BD311DRAFT_208697 [Dichomitus squalens]